MKILIIAALMVGLGVTAAQACRWGQTCMTNSSGITQCFCNAGPGGYGG